MVPTAIVTGCALAVIASGYLKLLRPGPAQTAIDAAELPVLSGWPYAARAVGAAEMLIGFAVVVSGHVVATTMLSILYVGFVVFIVRLRAEAPDSGCGCIGDASEPPGVVHVILCVNAAIICSPTVASTAEPLVELDAIEIVGSLMSATAIALLILLLPAALRSRRPKA